MKVVATQTPNQPQPEQPDKKPSFLLWLATWLKSKLGSMAIVKPIDAETENVVPDTYYRWKFKIMTRAGQINGSITARNEKEAKELALVQYVQTVGISVEVIGEVKK